MVCLRQTKRHLSLGKVTILVLCKRDDSQKTLNFNKSVIFLFVCERYESIGTLRRSVVDHNGLLFSCRSLETG